MVSRSKRIIKLKIDPDRLRWGKLKIPPKPIKRSKYAQSLFKEGAGWDE